MNPNTKYPKKRVDGVKKVDSGLVPKAEEVLSGEAMRNRSQSMKVGVELDRLNRVDSVERDHGATKVFNPTIQNTIIQQQIWYMILTY